MTTFFLSRYYSNCSKFTFIFLTLWCTIESVDNDQNDFRLRKLFAAQVKILAYLIDSTHLLKRCEILAISDSKEFSGLNELIPEIASGNQPINVLVLQSAVNNSERENLFEFIKIQPATKSSDETWKRNFRHHSDFCTTVIFVSNLMYSYTPTSFENLGLKYFLNSKFYPMTRSNEDLYIFVSLMSINLEEITQNVKALEYSTALLVLIETEETIIDNQSLNVNQLTLILKRICMLCNNNGDIIKMTTLMNNDWTRMVTLNLTPLVNHLFSNKKFNLYGRTLKISGATVFTSSILINQEVDTGKYRISGGVYWYLFQTLQEKLNFSIEALPCPGGSGILLKNGSWTGVMSDVVERRADIGVHAGRSWQRFQYTDWTGTPEVYFLTFIMAKPSPVFEWQAVFYPLQSTVWFACFLAIFFGSLIMFRFDKIGENSNYLEFGPQTKVGLFEIIRFATCSFVENPTLFNAKISFRLKFFTAFWSFTALVVATGYRAKLVGMLTFPAHPQLPQNFDDLASSDFDWYLHHYGGLAEDLIKHSTRPGVIKIGEKMKLEKNLSKCFLDASRPKRACINFSGVAEETFIMDFSDQFGRSNLVYAPSQEFCIMGGPVISKRAYFAVTFQRAFAQIQEGGLHFIWTKFRYDDERLRRKQNKMKQAIEIKLKVDDDQLLILRLKNLQGAYALFAFGLASSFFLFLVEKCFAHIFLVVARINSV